MELRFSILFGTIPQLRLVRLSIASGALVYCFLALLAGCRPARQDQVSPGPYSTDASEAGPLRVTVMEDRGMVETLRREWGAVTDTPFEIQELSLEEWERETRRPIEADVVIFPARCLGQLVADKQLRPLDDTFLAQPSLGMLEVFDLIRRKEIRWGDRGYGISLGNPLLALLVRQDLGEGAMPARGEKAPLDTSTWESVSAAIQGEIGKGLPADVAPILMPLGEGWGGRMFLMRVAPMLHQRDRLSTFFDAFTMEPLIHTAPFVEGLQNLKRDIQGGPPEMLSYSPQDVLEQFVQGKGWIAVTWPGAAVRGNSGPNPDEKTVEFDVVVRPWPGSSRAYDYSSDQWKDRSPANLAVSWGGGLIASLTRHGNHPQRGETLLTWLGQGERGAMIASASPLTAPSRRSHVGQRDWTDRRLPQNVSQEYGVYLEQVLTGIDAVLLPRIPGEARYMRVLDDAVRQVLRGEAEADIALQQVAESWRGITSEMGTPQQLRAYRISLGMDAALTP